SASPTGADAHDIASEGSAFKPATDNPLNRGPSLHIRSLVVQGRAVSDAPTISRDEDRSRIASPRLFPERSTEEKVEAMMYAQSVKVVLCRVRHQASIYGNQFE